MLDDLNGDWVVDESDSTILDSNWASGVQNPTKAQGDPDGVINLNDLDLVFAQYGLALDLVG